MSHLPNFNHFSSESTDPKSAITRLGQLGLGPYEGMSFLERIESAEEAFSSDPIINKALSKVKSRLEEIIHERFPGPEGVWDFSDEYQQWAENISNDLSIDEIGPFEYLLINDVG